MTQNYPTHHVGIVQTCVYKLLVIIDESNIITVKKVLRTVALGKQKNWNGAVPALVALNYRVTSDIQIYT